MSIHQFPRQKPLPGQFELPRVKVFEIAHNLTVALLKAETDLLAANTAEEFSAAIAKVHELTSEASAGFAELVDVTRHWGSRK